MLPEFTAVENVAMPLRIARVARQEAHPRAEALLGEVGLGDRVDPRPWQLAGGEQQRVAVARALAAEPRVLLADEPTGNLDESMRDEILALLEGLCAEGITMIVVTHDSAGARRATRRLRLSKGAVQDITR